MAASKTPAPTNETQQKRTLLSAVGVFAERRALVMLALGFSAGLPFLLVFDTLSAWLRDDGLSLEVIGFFSLATLVYSFKFLWAPLVDRAMIPLLSPWLGHRRSWMLVCQAVIMLGLWLIAGTDPGSNLATMAAFAVLVGFAGATQDIAIDAWRIEVTEASKQGAMAAAYQWGYRIAMIVAGAAPLLLAEHYSWNFSYGVMAGLMLVGMLAVLAAPRETQHMIRAIAMEGASQNRALEIIEWLARLVLLALGAVILGSGLAANASALSWILQSAGLSAAAHAITAAWAAPARVWYQLLAVLLGFAVISLATLPMPGVRTRPGVYLFAALGDPLRDFFRRYRSVAALILALICFYRLSDFVLNIMNPFYLDLGFTLVEVAEVRKIFGVVASVLGIFLGGIAVARLGLIRAMVIGAFASPLSNLVFIWLAMRGHDLFGLFVAIGVDNVLAGFAGTALIAYMSSLTGRGFTATQYALFSSLYALPGRLIASQSGRIVEGAAASADAGGLASGLNGLFAAIPPETYAAAMEKSGVSPVALGSGYVVFFLYSVAIGVVAVILAFIVAARQENPLAETDAATPHPGAAQQAAG
jgi:PAT family beta-lactamase induction signal transducer AmpG